MTGSAIITIIFSTWSLSSRTSLDAMNDPTNDAAAESRPVRMSMFPVRRKRPEDTVVPQAEQNLLQP